MKSKPECSFILTGGKKFFYFFYSSFHSKVNLMMVCKSQKKSQMYTLKNVKQIEKFLREKPARRCY